MQLTWTCACDSRPAAIRFLVAETPTERLEVRKTEKGERGLSIDYRIVESEPREEEICATYVGPTSWACKLTSTAVASASRMHHLGTGTTVQP